MTEHYLIFEREKEICYKNMLLFSLMLEQLN